MSFESQTASNKYFKRSNHVYQHGNDVFIHILDRKFRYLMGILFVYISIFISNREDLILFNDYQI